MRLDVFSGAVQADFFDAPQGKAGSTVKIRGTLGQHASRFQNRDRAGGWVSCALGDVVAVIVTTQHHDLVRLLSAGQVADDVPRGHGLAAIGAGQTDPHFSLTLHEPLDEGAIFVADREAGDQPFAIVSNATRGRAKTRVVVDKDKARCTGQKAASILFAAMDPSL